ncbi:hypothetical protein TNCV_1958351 [Trichonephila clavipes]|nr:hypothetical protein TNCV_1958351 [Trichonephila clavipes]
MSMGPSPIEQLNRFPEKRHSSASSLLYNATERELQFEDFPWKQRAEISVFPPTHLEGKGEARYVCRPRIRTKNSLETMDTGEKRIKRGSHAKGDFKQQ